MTPVEVVGAILVVLVLVGWWLSWLATRLDRAHARVERSWAALDAALVRRAHAAVTAAGNADVDPASALLVADAAAAALDEDLTPGQRELAESNLTLVLGLMAWPELTDAGERVALARRLHNDAVANALALRRRPVVAIFRLAGRAAEPRAFEMTAERQLPWAGGIRG